MYLSLPLPTTKLMATEATKKKITTTATTTFTKKSNLNIIYVPYSPSQRQLKMTIQLNRNAQVEQLKQEVKKSIIASSLFITGDYSLLVVEIDTGTITKVYSDTDLLFNYTPSTDSIIYVYQLSCPSLTDPNWVIFPVYCSTPLVHTTSIISTSKQFGYPIVLSLEKNKLKSNQDLYEIIVKHIERYCIVKLYFESDTAIEEDDQYTDKRTTVPSTEEAQPQQKDGIVNSLLIQQPIYTTAAVTPTGKRPLIPMPNLFNIRLFETKHLGNNFPMGIVVTWIHFMEGEGEEKQQQPFDIRQGQGVLIEWTVSKAQQIFGSCSSDSTAIPSSNDNDIDLLYNTSRHCGINTEAWFECEELPPVTQDGSSGNGSKPNNSNSSKNPVSTTIITLDDCLDEFTQAEQLDHQNSWYCPRCKDHKKALKKLDLWKLPDNLVIHLKRFSQSRRWWDQKLDNFVDFPIEGLNLTGRVVGKEEGESFIYDLYAVDNHYGGLNGGHYTAFAKNAENRDWYKFDDSRVSKVTFPDDVKTEAAYLLFYKRRH